MSLAQRGIGGRVAIGLGVVGIAGAAAVARSLLDVPSSPTTSEDPDGKAPSESSISVTHVIAPADCNAHGRATAGTILKLIDVVAGIVSRRHAGQKTVTVSVDRVIFLAPARCNDLVHLSASVNRTWSTSIEVGVRLLAQDAKTGAMSYSSHSYLTFVVMTEPAPPRLWGLLAPAKPSRIALPPVKPVTLLEQKRFVLAGRRRSARLKRKDEDAAIFAGFRELVYGLISPLDASASEAAIAPERIAAIERDLLVDAFVAKDPDVSVEDGQVVYRLSDAEIIAVPLAEVEHAAAARGRGRRLDISRSLSTRGASQDEHVLTGQLAAEAPLQLADTLIVTCQIVMPQHSNSKSILFGGQLLAWIETNANASARMVYPAASWALATLDSMTFHTPVRIGEACTIRSVVIRTYGSSVEVYSVVTADSLEAPTPRFVADALLVLVGLDGDSQPIRESRLRQISVPEGPAAQLAAGSADRRQARTQAREILLRVYGAS